MSTLSAVIKNPSATIVDVRSAMEFNMEHVPGALNIPLEQVMGRVEEFKSMSKPLVLYCRSGNRSGMAMAMLKAAGLTEVYNGGGLYDMMMYAN